MRVFGLILSFLLMKTASPEVYSQKWETLNRVYGYAAINIFDKGYVRETGPEDVPLEKGVTKLALPKGFRHGILSLKTAAKSKYKIGVSFDLNNWEFYDYPGYGVKNRYSLNLEKENLTDELVYLKFLPSQNENLSVYFDVFQYTANRLSDKSEHYGYFLFFPDIDIDYQGKKIIQPGVIYEK